MIKALRRPPGRRRALHDRPRRSRRRRAPARKGVKTRPVLTPAPIASVASTIVTASRIRSTPYLHGMRPAARTGQAPSGPSVASPSVGTWRYAPRITPMAPPSGGPLRVPQTPPVTGRHTVAGRRNRAAGRDLAQRRRRRMATRFQRASCGGLDLGTGVGAAAIKPGAGPVVTFQVAGPGGVPSTGAPAVVFNVTITEASGAGFVQVLPTGRRKSAIRRT